MTLTLPQTLTIASPLLSFIDNRLIHTNSNFLLITCILFLYLYLYPMQPLKNANMELLRKYAMLVSGSWLTIVLAGEIEVIVVEVYRLEFGGEICFICRVVLLLVNAEILLSALKRNRNDIVLPL